MPELPDILVYIDALSRHIGGQRVEKVLLRSPFVVRTFQPELVDLTGKRILGFRRFGKRIVWEVEDDLFLVFHLMIAGRFHWRKVGVVPRSKRDLVAFQFQDGTLMLTEASAKKRASIHIVRGESNLGDYHRGGIEVLDCSYHQFREALLCENHTLKRSLTDQRLFSGIGNAYSDEILHAAQLSPIRWTSRLTDAEVKRLFTATQETLRRWTQILSKEVGTSFPKNVTAFRPGMAVHGRYNEPCPECGCTVQRIVYAINETNYCPRCQTNGKLLADRSLSRLLKNDWPKKIEDWEGNE